MCRSGKSVDWGEIREPCAPCMGSGGADATIPRRGTRTFLRWNRRIISGTGSISPVNTILPETAPRPKRPCSRRMAPMRRRPSVLRARLARLPAPVTKAQRQRERALRNASGRRRRPLTRDWRISRNRNLFLNADGYNVVVYPAGRWWSFRVSNWLTEKILAGDHVLVSMDAAKLTAFDAYDLDERARRLTGILSITVVRAT
jgi:hypothetical protein